MTNGEDEPSPYKGTATVEGNEIVVRWPLDSALVVDAFAQTLDAETDEAIISEANELGRDGLIQLLANTLASAAEYLADNGPDSVGASAYDFITDVVEVVLEKGRYSE